MKFKHSFHVFVDNFSVTYKQLLYRLVVWIIAACLYSAILIPFFKALTGSPNFTLLTEGIKEFLKDLVNGRVDEVAADSQQIKEAFEALLKFVADSKANITLGIIGVTVVSLIAKFFSGLGNYATAAVINDKMALRANSPFLLTLIRNLKEASLYNLIYVPISFIYDTACFTAMYFFVFWLLALLPFIFLPLQIFLFVTASVVIIAVKMTFTADWLPALIRGKSGQKQAFLYTFDRRRKSTFNVLSNFVVIILCVFAINVCAIVFTFGAAGLLTIPSSYVIILSFEFVNYYDREELKYFIDKNTIIKPEHEKTVTREEFFRGE